MQFVKKKSAFNAKNLKELHLFGIIQRIIVLKFE